MDKIRSSERIFSFVQKEEILELEIQMHDLSRVTITHTQATHMYVYVYVCILYMYTYTYILACMHVFFWVGVAGGG